MIDNECISQPLGLSNFFETLKFKIKFNKDNPNYFWSDGLVIFVGPQGSGKTLSAVNYVCKLMKKYPKSKLVTNLYLKDYPVVTFEQFLKENYSKKTFMNFNNLSEYKRKQIAEDYFTLNRVFEFTNSEDLSLFNNLDEGVIYLIDEIQLYYNSLESKNINPEVMTEISQQRKQRKHIVATSQVFGRMAKPLREQFSNVVVCKCLFKLLQFNKLIDREDIEEDGNSSNIKGKVKKNIIYFHSPFMYNNYDTYYKIERNKFVSNEEKKGDIYDRGNTVLVNGGK